jgi:hypothetical protein
MLFISFELKHIVQQSWNVMQLMDKLTMSLVIEQYVLHCKDQTFLNIVLLVVTLLITSFKYTVGQRKIFLIVHMTFK